MAQMLGWFRAASIRASRSKRARRCASRVNARGRILIEIAEFAFPFDAVNGADVGVVQGREHPRLALETSETLRVAGECAREDLDRDSGVRLPLRCRKWRRCWGGSGPRASAPRARNERDAARRG